jgi:hypothetical protein
MLIAMVKILTKVRMSIAFHPTSAWFLLKVGIANHRFQELNHSIPPDQVAESCRTLYLQT